MKLQFAKMSGAGNDFVVLDNRDERLNLTSAQIERLCHRQFGVGADGLLAVEPGADGADFRMRYYNADGGEADMCGNGARCFARFAHSFQSPGAEGITFNTPAGLIVGKFFGEDVEVNLTEPHGLALRQSVGPTGETHSINTGVPHAIVFVEHVEDTPVIEWGRILRYHEAFAPRGTNVNFVEVLGDDEIAVRTYERGVEGETLACGTGVTAAAIIAHVVRGVSKPVSVRVHSGDVLKVSFEHRAGAFSDVKLQGPAVITFRGEIDL